MLDGFKGWFGRGYREYLERTLCDVRAERDRLVDQKRAQMGRADRAERDLDAERERRKAEAERLRAAVAEHANAANYYGKLAEDRRVESASLRLDLAAARAEVARLETLIGNARNQLDGRQHHPEEAECAACSQA